MALIRVHVHLLPPTRPFGFAKFQTYPSLHYDQTPPKLRISCSSSNSNSNSNSNSSNINDMELAMDLATEIDKMNTQMLQAQEAMKRSRKMLYAELCLFLGLGREELSRKWERMEEDDKWVLAEEFVSDWGSNFHPLSARSVKELIDHHLCHDDDDGNHNNKDANSSSSSSILFSGLKKLIGFPDTE